MKFRGHNSCKVLTPKLPFRKTATQITSPPHVRSEGRDAFRQATETLSQFRGFQRSSSLFAVVVLKQKAI